MIQKILLLCLLPVNLTMAGLMVDIHQPQKFGNEPIEFYRTFSYISVHYSTEAYVVRKYDKCDMHIKQNDDWNNSAYLIEIGHLVAECFGADHNQGVSIPQYNTTVNYPTYNESYQLVNPSHYKYVELRTMDFDTLNEKLQQLKPDNGLA